jgi:hypothetical protein
MAEERTLSELVAGLQAEEAALPAKAVDVEYCERQQLLAHMGATFAQDPAAIAVVQDDLFRYVELVRNSIGEAEFARKANRIRIATEALKALQSLGPEQRRSFFDRVDNVVANYYDKTRGRAA